MIHGSNGNYPKNILVQCISFKQKYRKVLLQYFSCIRNKVSFVINASITMYEVLLVSNIKNIFHASNRRIMKFFSQKNVENCNHMCIISEIIA